MVPRDRRVNLTTVAENGEIVLEFFVAGVQL